MFKKLACFTGWLVVLCLSLMFCFIFGLWRNWSTPAILVFWLLVLLLIPLMWSVLHGLTLLLKGKKKLRLLSKYSLSRREYVLRNHWKAGASVIRRIKRKRTRLPWYLLVGDRCGKSTLLAGSGVPRFYGETEITEVCPTRTLNWWFFRKLCVLDISSNFLHTTSSFRLAWGKLANWCTRMPAPAGIIIAIPITVLMKGEASVLHEIARQHRALIDPLVRHFRERLPLYIMVTQCDHFPGFSLWQQQLSEQQRQQSLGYIWPTSPYIDSQDEYTLQPLFMALKGAFSWARLSMGRPEQCSVPEYMTLIDFPEKFSELEPSLRQVLATLCESNAYFSHITLNGVWFSSTGPQNENKSRRISYFVHDLFSGHLQTIHPHSGTQRRDRYRQALSVLVLAGGMLWVTISAALSSERLEPAIDKMPPEALVAFLARDEQHSVTALRYLPFLPLFQQKHRQAEARLAQIKTAPRSVQHALTEYQQYVLSAPAEQQRELILQLARALTIWQQMRNDIPLGDLLNAPPVSEKLYQRIYPANLEPHVKLALERYYMQQSEGENWLRLAKALLVRLVSHDPSLTWLLADSKELAPLQARDFWSSLPATLSVASIWSRQGEFVVNEWMTQIENAAGEKLPVFQKLRSEWPARQQAAWSEYLVNVTASLAPETYKILSHSQLIALGQNQSQSMQFIEHIISELSSISTSEADNWLTTLRHLHHLSMLNHDPALLTQVKSVDARLRQSLTSWFQGKSRTLSVVRDPAMPVWSQWQKVRNLAVKDALSLGNSSPRLTRGLFTDVQQATERNPLLDLFPTLASLQEKLTPRSDETDVSAVWFLYKNDARQLLAHAMTQSACWLNAQWKSTVIWPLNKNANRLSYEEQQVAAMRYVRKFMQDQAKTLLFTGKEGLTAGEYAGMKVPLSDDFLRMARLSFTPDVILDLPERASTQDGDIRAALKEKMAALEKQKTEQEKTKWRVSIASMPATVPGGAKVIPVGTRLTLHCQTGNQQLSSMNFADKSTFFWQPGQCQELSLDVKFPDFTVTHQLIGDEPWLGFINDFSSGEVLFDSEDFGDSEVLLKNMGIKNILVRFVISDQQPLQEAAHNWRDLNMRINQLEVQLTQLDERIQRQQKDASSIPSLSVFPTEIAQCQ
jgi:type VI secretion system protein ImpL